MWQALKEHARDVMADVVLKRVLPSVLAAWSVDLARRLNMGHPALSDNSIRALTGIAILLTHYFLHLWDALKRMAAARKPQA